MEKAKQKGILITVGTTNFNPLIKEIDNVIFYENLISSGFTHVYF
jgi:hypothetical protein